MPDLAKFDMNYRPPSYWGPQTLSRKAESTIKGELRKAAVMVFCDQGPVDARFFAESLPEEQRVAIGSCHPWLMGGEYLPDLRPDEVEIARVVMKSTTMDVVSIRARKAGRRIRYSIVDEYEEEGCREYVVSPRTSTRPLTLKQLIKMMDGAVDDGLVGSCRNANYMESEKVRPHEYYDFETASSAFYPKLAAWYDARNQEWLEKELEKLREEDE
ncbi:MAG: hypothetical protein IPM60_06145 [Rhodospirillales bacterium]|nr:hypothetical protein [Rhodospirillales bacterium]